MEKTYRAENKILKRERERELQQKEKHVADN